MKFWQTIVRVLTPPRVEDEGEYRTIRIVHTLSAATMIGISLLVLHHASEGQYSLIPPMLVAWAVSLGAIIWSRRGRVAWAGIALSWTLLLVLEYFAWTNGGLTDTSMMAVPGVLVIGGLVLERRHFYIFTAVCVLATGLLGYMDLTGQIHIVHLESVVIDDILDVIVIFGITAVTVRVLADGLIRNLRIVQENEREIRIQADQLRLSEERYRTLFEGANDAILIMNEQGIVETNSMGLTMFGCAERSELVGYGPWDFSGPQQPDGSDSKQKALVLLNKALDGIPQRFTWRHCRRDGTTFDAEVSLNRVVAGNQSLVQATVRDVTDRVVAEEAMRKSDAHFRLLFNSIDDAVFVHGLTKDGLPGKILEANEVTCRRLGYSHEELLRMSPLDFDAPETIPAVPGALKTVLRDGSSTWEGVHIAKDGRRIPVEISNHLFELDGNPALLATVRDITARKQAEEVRIQSEEKFKNLFNNAEVGMFRIRLDGSEILDANARFFEIIGRKKEEVLANPPAIHWVDQHQRTEMDRRLQEQGSVSNFECGILNRLGEVRHCLTSLRQYSEQGILEGSILDITDRKRASDVLMKYQTLSENARDVILFVRFEDGRIVEANGAAERMYGYTRDELQSLNISDLREASAGTGMKNQMQMADMNGVLFETVHRRRDGTPIDVEVSSVGTTIGESRVLLSIVRDITERKQAEERLRNLAYAIRSISESVYVTDIDGQVAFVNEAFGKTFGYDEHEVVGKRDTVFLSPENFPDVLQVMREASKLEGWRGEVYCRRKNGGRFEVQLSLSPIRNERGEVMALVGVATDITNRKMVERALRESEEKFRTIVNTTSEWIWDLSVTGMLTYSNPAVKTILGYSPEELIGKAALDHIHESDREKITQLLLRCVKLKQGWRDLVIRWRHKDGSYRFLESNSTPVIDLQGDLTGFHGADRDVTDRKLMEDRLRISEEYYRTLVDTSPDAIVIVDTSGFLSFVSQKAYQMFDVPKGNVVIGTSVTDWLVPARRKEVIKTLRSVLSGDSKAIAMEVELLKHDRTAFWAEVSTSPLANVKGEVRGLLLICRDVSERKGAEEALRQAQRMESIGILAGGIAHDFNNLLQAILGQAHLALNKIPLSSEGRANIEKAEKAAERAAHLTRQLLAYSGQGKLNMHTLDINTIIRDHVPLLAMAIPKVVSLKLDLCERPLHLKGDCAQIQQTVMNLVINAAEAMEGRSGQLRVGSAQYTISASDVGRWTRAGAEIEPGAYVGFEVSDNGCGMDDQTLARIFEPFFTTKFTGRGLGLPAVLGIVRGHRGALQVESKKGAGTTFRVAFPQTEQNMDSDSMITPAEVPSDRVTVLLIDDEEVVREVFTETLSDGGFRILVASDGESGVELFKKYLADVSLIVLDLSMPGIDGAETFKRIRAIDPNVKVILSSGYAEEEAMDRFEGLGLAGFLQKPYQWSRLVQILGGYIH